MAHLHRKTNLRTFRSARSELIFLRRVESRMKCLILFLLLTPAILRAQSVSMVPSKIDFGTVTAGDSARGTSVPVILEPDRTQWPGVVSIRNDTAHAFHSPDSALHRL